MDLFKEDDEKDRQRVLKALEQYPYSFKMKDIGLVKPSAFKALRNDLKAGLDAGYSTSLQTASARNLLAFALFQLGKHQNALKEIKEVLKMDDQRNNIVSLANKAYMLSQLSWFDDAEEALDELGELRESPEFGYLRVKAKAELAASYMRFGPRFSQHAVNAFWEVLPEAKEPEVWMWKYCLAVTYRHTLDLQHAPYLSHGQSTVTHEDALKLFKEVINSEPTAGEEAAHRNLKANAYAEMALLLRLTWDKTSEYDLCSQAQTGPMACCKKALELDDNDASVLWKSGKIYRNYKDLFKSRKLLVKAVNLHPSSAAYHHLGLTYKAMATSLQYGKLKTRRGGRREKERRKAREEKTKCEQAERGDVSQHDVTPGHTVPVSGQDIRQHERMERIKRAVKSPDDATQFDSQEPYVLLAVEYLTKAIEFSAGENSRAAYDLALLYKSMKDFDRAIDTFDSILLRKNGEIATPSGLLDHITSLDQMGLIKKQMADEETNERERQKLNKQSKSCLYGVLSLLGRFYSPVEDVKDIFGQIFNSPDALFKATDASDQSDSAKQKNRAKIYSMINNHKQAYACLADVALQERDAEYKKLQIEVFAGDGEHEKAASCLSMWYSEVIGLFERQQNVHFIFDIYFNAGKQTLSDGPCKYEYFTEAFRHKVKPPVQQAFDNVPSTSGDDSFRQRGAVAMDKGSSDPGSEELWDIMLLHDDEDSDIERKADRLKNILETACGLRVVRRDDNFLEGHRERTCIVDNIGKSRLVVVLPGTQERLPEFEEFVNTAALKEFAVLLTEGVGPAAIPLELKTSRLRDMACPAELFAPDVDATGPYPPEFINAICQLFKFFVKRE